MSVCLHAMALAGAGSISFTATPTKPKPPVMGAMPAVIRIADRLYYVTRDAPPKVAATPAPARTVTPAKVGQALPPAKPAPRVFIPPEARKQAAAEVTLLQPLLAPAPIQAIPELPSFLVATAQPQAPRKRFVVPGRRTPPPPDPVLPDPPSPDLVHADPVALDLKPMLVLPPSRPSLADAPPPKTAVSVAPPTPVGDPVSILSLNDKPVPLTEQLVVPPVNVGQALAPALSPANAEHSAGPRTTESPEFRLIGPPAVSRTAATPGSRGGEVTIVGGVQATKQPSAGPMVIVRPANGTFDAVLVQSSPLDQFPESKGLLTGRPIYTVYVSLGTAKDWALYFCIPGEQPPANSNPSVMNLGPSTPVQAPYPTRLMPPKIEAPLPPYLKYILVHGFVTAAGQVENLSIVRPIRPETDRAVVASLAGWEFRAATRDGIKIAVEFLLSIPVSGL